VIALLRWLGFGVGLLVATGTVIGVMKTFIVPRRSWSFMPATIGRNGFQLFRWVAVRLPSFDLADRFLGFLAPTVIIGTLVSFLASFVLAFALLLLPWTDLTLGEALRESGSSVFTLGFVATREPVPTALDILGGATGMIFVTLTIGYLPTLYGEVIRREVLVKQLEGWIGAPSWGPEVLAQLARVGGMDGLPELLRSWDTWAARVGESHMKYPVLTQFRLLRAGNHWAVALLAVMDAAALDLVLRPGGDRSARRLFLRQGVACLDAVAYPMRRVVAGADQAGLDRAGFEAGVKHMVEAGYAPEVSPRQAWDSFQALRSTYATTAYQLLYWTMAAPAPWSGPRAGSSST
jgi:hypothetical protein